MPQQRAPGWWRTLRVLFGIGGVCSILRGAIYSPLFGTVAPLPPGLSVLSPTLLVWSTLWAVGGVMLIVTASAGFRRMFWPAVGFTMLPLILWLIAYVYGFGQDPGRPYIAAVSLLGVVTYAQVITWLLGLIVAINIIRRLLLHIGERS